MSTTTGLLSDSDRGLLPSSSSSLNNNGQQQFAPSESFVNIHDDMIPSQSTLDQYGRSPSIDSGLFQNKEIKGCRQCFFSLVYTRGYLIYFLLLCLVQIAVFGYAMVYTLVTHNEKEALWIVIFEAVVIVLNLFDVFLRMIATGFKRYFIRDKHSCFNVIDLVIIIASSLTFGLHFIKTKVAVISIIFAMIRTFARALRLIFLLWKHHRISRVVDAVTEYDIDIADDEIQLIHARRRRVERQTSHEFHHHNQQQQREHIVPEDDEDNLHVGYSTYQHQSLQQHGRQSMHFGESRMSLHYSLEGGSSAGVGSSALGQSVGGPILPVGVPGLQHSAHDHHYPHQHHHAIGSSQLGVKPSTPSQQPSAMLDYDEGELYAESYTETTDSQLITSISSHPHQHQQQSQQGFHNSGGWGPNQGMMGLPGSFGTAGTSPIDPNRQRLSFHNGGIF